MIPEATLLLVQYVLLFVLALVFTGFALDRRTLLCNLLASFFWCALALTNFMIGYTVIGSSLSYIFGSVCFVIMGNFILQMYYAYLDTLRSKYRFEPA